MQSKEQIDRAYKKAERVERATKAALAALITWSRRHDLDNGETLSAPNEKLYTAAKNLRKAMDTQ